MTYEETLDKLNQSCDECLIKCTEEECLLFVCKETLDKQIPKKAHRTGKTTYRCPSCVMEYASMQPHYCEYCGQKIDWSSEEE